MNTIVTMLLCLALTASVYAQEPKALTLKVRIALPGVEGRIDHLSADIAGQRLFVAALANHTVEVFDIKAGQRLKTIPNLAEPQGVLFDAASNHLFVACASDGTVKVFDGSSFQLLRTTTTSGDADNVRYDAPAKRVLVGYGGGALGLLDGDGSHVGDIPLDAHPESFQLEKGGGRAFVNVPQSKEIQVVDLRKPSSAVRWPVTEALKNYPMALDEGHHRLLAGCRSPARLLTLDTESGKVTSATAIVGDTDDLFYDAANSRVYVIGGEGFVDVLRQKDADHYERTERLPTGAGARTGLFVAEWRRLFVAVPHRGEQRAEILIFEAN
jgi:DNA-binding beta-propeller fold protein YncE